MTALDDLAKLGELAWQAEIILRQYLNIRMYGETAEETLPVLDGAVEIWLRAYQDVVNP